MSKTPTATTELREHIIQEFERVLGSPLPVFVRRRDIEQLGIRSVWSLTKDACQGTDIILPDGKIGNQPTFLVNRLIEFAVTSCSGTRKGRRPQIATNNPEAYDE